SRKPDESTALSFLVEQLQVWVHEQKHISLITRHGYYQPFMVDQQLKAPDALSVEQGQALVSRGVQDKPALHCIESSGCLVIERQSPGGQGNSFRGTLFRPGEDETRPVLRQA